MADVEIAVQAEGVEDAVGEVPPGEETGMGDGADGGGDGRGGGRLGRLLGVIATLLAFTEDIAKVIGVVSSVLRAFLAPVAVLLLRLLAPFIRTALQFLPAYLSLFENLNSKLEGFPGLIPFLAIMFFKVVAKLQSLADGILQDVKDKIKELPGKLSTAIADQIPGVDSGSGDNFAPGPQEGGDVARAAGVGFATGGPSQAITNVVLQGGISTLIDGVQSDSGVETP